MEAKPEEVEEPEEEGLDVPDNELGAVMEFDEDELDEAQTEANVKNITNKHQITLEELKREVLGSVRKRVSFVDASIRKSRKLLGVPGAYFFFSWITDTDNLNILFFTCLTFLPSIKNIKTNIAYKHHITLTQERVAWSGKGKVF